MLLKEYRITLPLTVEEYQIAQLYALAEVSKNETGGGEGIEVLRNEPFSNRPLLTGKYSSGQYTYKIYHLASKIPRFIRLLAPKGSLEIYEEAWDAYPYCRTVITNPNFMKEKFKIVIDSLHVKNDRGEQYNVHELSPEKLKNREIVYIDIANDLVSSADYNSNEDPTKFQSKKTGRGPLEELNWRKKVVPVMTCYKLVACEFKWFGLQARIESFLQKSEQRIFTIFHRQLFCWMDRWYGLTINDIRAIEEKVKMELEKQRFNGQVRGMRAVAD